MSDLICGRIAAGEKYNLTRDNLLYKYFWEVQIPKAVFDELTSNQRFALGAEEIKK